MKYILSAFVVFLMSATSSAYAGDEGNMTLQQLIGVSETPYDFSGMSAPEGGRSRAMARANGGMRVKGGGRAGRAPRAR